MAARMEAAGYRQVEHTADLALEIWARDDAELLRVGARAIVDLLTESASVTSSEHRIVELDVVDDADRLVRFLAEVLFLGMVEGYLVDDAHFEFEPGRLRATLHGQSGAQSLLRAEIKSVTYHDLHIVRTEGRVTAVVVLDV